MQPCLAIRAGPLAIGLMLPVFRDGMWGRSVWHETDASDAAGSFPELTQGARQARAALASIFHVDHDLVAAQECGFERWIKSGKSRCP